MYSTYMHLSKLFEGKIYFFPHSHVHSAKGERRRNVWFFFGFWVPFQLAEEYISHRAESIVKHFSQRIRPMHWTDICEGVARATWIEQQQQHRNGASSCFLHLLVVQRILIRGKLGVIAKKSSCNSGFLMEDVFMALCITYVEQGRW